MEFFFTRHFLRALKKLPKGVQEDVVDAIDRFKEGGEYKKLRLHALSGRMKKYHAFSANFSYRIIIEMKKDSVYFLDVGDHDVYQ